MRKRLPKRRLDIKAELARPRLLAMLFCGYYIGPGDGPPSVLDIVDFAYTDSGSESIRGVGFYLKLAQVKDGTIEIVIYDPKGREVGSASGTLKRENERDAPDILNITSRIAFNIPIAGTYFFAVTFNGEPLGGAPLTVRFVDPSEVEQDEDGSDV